MLKTLKKYWGYERFRPGQEEIITEVLKRLKIKAFRMP